MKRVYPIYIRIAKRSFRWSSQGFKVDVSNKKLNTPLMASYSNKTPLPTLQFKINVEIDDKEFDEVKKVLDLKLENLEPAIELKEELKQEIKK
jgi:hypothetical protein